jgi:hypothetical protein
VRCSRRRTRATDAGLSRLVLADLRKLRLDRSGHVDVHRLLCSYYSNWFNVGMAKTCYPGCDWNYNTTGVMMYGFENHDRIRGRFSSKGEVTLYSRPSELSMSGTLRAQVTWYGGPASQINAAAIG